jgi:hypothetical protein
MRPSINKLWYQGIEFILLLSKIKNKNKNKIE